MYESPVQVSLEFTPNPNTLKYSINRVLIDHGAVNFRNAQEAVGKSPLAEKIFQISGIEAIMFGRDFVTITKTENGDWDVVHQGCMTILESHLSQGEPILTGEKSHQGKTGSTEIEKKIIHILETEVRPAVAMDGGDITFEKFENGTVYVYLQGACSGCPSSTMTLKMGIEERLKREISEVKEVVSV